MTVNHLAFAEGKTLRNFFHGPKVTGILRVAFRLIRYQLDLRLQ
jgi:hypothetical protein